MWLTATSDTGANIVPRVRLYNAADSYAGVVNSGLYLWGMQLEQATIPSSYLPTTTGSVPRNEDQLRFPTTGNVSVLSDFTVYVEAEPKFILPSGGGWNMILNTNVNYAMNMRLATAVGSGNVDFFTNTAGAPSSTISMVDYQKTSFNKFAARKDSASFRIAANGTLGADSGGLGVQPAEPVLMYVGLRLTGPMRNLRIAKTALSSGEIAAITR